MKKIFAANWKMNKTPDESKAFVENFKVKIDQDFFKTRDIFIFPQNFSLAVTLSQCAQTPIRIGPQNIGPENSGAFTGENSLAVAKAMGSTTVLIGHSERRILNGETNEMIAKKMKLALQQSLLPVLCIGESLKERESRESNRVCSEQLEQALAGINAETEFIVAYEPVWAIGTGRVATADQVRQMHEHIFSTLSGRGFKNFKILYGGSVKSDNAKELIQIPHVDGFLIGGAALEVSSFLDICNSIK